jgi:hypothetical protein
VTGSLRQVALDAAVDALLDHPWRPNDPTSAHRHHGERHDCAICRGDIRRITRIALIAADNALRHHADHPTTATNTQETT